MSKPVPQRRVLVIGAGAPIGEALVRVLLDDDRVSHVLAATGHPADSFPIEGREGLTVRSVDITRNRQLHHLLFDTAKGLNIDTVIHTAMHSSATDEVIVPRYTADGCIQSREVIIRLLLHERA